MCITFDTAILLLKIHPFETKSQTRKDECRRQFTAAPFVTPITGNNLMALKKAMVKHIKIVVHPPGTQSCSQQRGARVFVLTLKSKIY